MTSALAESLNEIPYRRAAYAQLGGFFVKYSAGTVPRAVDSRALKLESAIAAMACSAVRLPFRQPIALRSALCPSQALSRLPPTAWEREKTTADPRRPYVILPNS